jgi:hypothetical protein
MRVRIAVTMAIATLIAVSGLARAQSGGTPLAEYTLSASEGLGAGYDLTWHTVDNGGITFSMSDGYQLGGAIGQPDAGVLIGGDYTLVSGFWQSGAVSQSLDHDIYLPCVLRNL